MIECNQNEHVTDWKIEKFSCCLQTTGEKFSTGQFTSQKLGNTSWQVHLYPRGIEDANYISCFLERKDDSNVGPREIRVNFKFSLVTSDGLLCEETVKSEEYCFTKETTFGFKNFMKRDAIFGNKEIYLLKDMLTLRCRMRKCIPQIKQNIINVRTIIDAQIPRFRIPISISGKGAKKTVFPISTKKVKDILTLTVYVEKDKVLEEPKQSKGKKADCASDSTVHIDITKRKIVTPLYVSCHVKVPLLSDDPEDNFPLEHTAVHLFEEKSQKEIWNFPRFIKISKLTKSMIQASTFVLDFDINVCDECFQTYLEDLPQIKYASIGDDRTLKKDLVTLYETGLYSDAKLKIRDECFLVHKSILSIRSTVFKKLFEEQANIESIPDGKDPKKDQECVLELTDVDKDTLKRLLNFVYADVFDVEDFTSCLSLYASALKYEISILKQECFNFLQVHMSVKETFTTLLLAEELNDGDLKLLALNVIADNHEYALLTDEWVQFTEKEPELMSHVLQHIRSNKKKNRL
ncbi:tdpoz4 [Trichonephila clavata]|uniref:Tdpoz4 n=1 Tax=Trichonephila clavata TaxID=2740835 RepID=A0A8X6HPA7_TRICU|nr:tdpoz4 [Trichonephila clavata]